ncbi:hypothetical protein CRG98_033516 [Punica granatum]|uniref:Uncharacterized protein n=1 Tax=Punica granatum TaxID=22663 RepID=A0A2I0IQ31_PUNGR|nr:hypothetical protein CRG98_033516 [Punica granatum]
MGERSNHYHKPHAGTRWGGGVRGLSDYRGAIFTIHTSVIRIGLDQVSLARNYSCEARQVRWGVGSEFQAGKMRN